MAKFSSPKIRSDQRYQGPIEPLSLWRGVGHNGKLNPSNEIRILAEHPDGGWIYEWRARRNDPDVRGQLGRAREESLRKIFRPVKPKPQEDTMTDKPIRRDDRGVELLGTTDPQRWAVEFEESVLAGFGDDVNIDRDVLVGWFANAMQAKESSILGLGTHKLSTEELHELVFEVGGAATAPCLAGAPDLVMPAEEVIEGINGVLASKGLPISEQKSLSTE